MSTKAKVAKFGALGFLAVALGCAAFAAFLVGNMMKSSYSGTKVVPVVVAKAEIKAGTVLNAGNVELREWPEDAVPPGAFHDIDGLLKTTEGSTAAVGILPGEPVVSSRLTSTKQGTGVASLLQANMRAFAMKVDDSVGYTGLVYPGAYIDIIATIRDPQGRGPSSRIAVQNARVLSVGMDADVATRRPREQRADRLTGSQDQGGTYVTLEVTPQEAEILAIARREGTVDVVLRNATDDQVIDTTGATPEKFSAFATDGDAEETTDATKAKKPEKRSRVTVRRQNRRIQLVASDDADSGTAPAKKPSSGKIETYNAQ